MYAIRTPILNTMPTVKLTDRFIRYEQPQKRTEYYDDVVKGLLIRISKGKVWYLRYRYNEKNRALKLGYWPELAVSEARAIAKAFKIEVLNGVDPAERVQNAKNEALKTVTVNQVIERYKEKVMREPNMRRSTIENYQRCIDKYIGPSVGSKPIDSIGKSDLISLYEKIAISQGKVQTANITNIVLGAILKFAADRDLIQIIPKLPQSVRVKPKVESRERVFNPDEIKAQWEYFTTHSRKVVGLYYQFLYLTGTRKTEASKIKWDDVDLQNKMIRISASTAKNHNELLIPILPRMEDLLHELKQLNGHRDFIFSDELRNKPFAEKSATLKIKNHFGEFAPHDIRHTFTTYLAKLGVPKETRGMLTNHKKDAGQLGVNALYNHYDYKDEKIKALNLWYDHLERIISGADMANIRSLKGA